MITVYKQQQNILKLIIEYIQYTKMFYYILPYLFVHVICQ